ncbi:hypothetical protein AB0A98_06265 [Streptomyces chrestomyceticus]|uniref:hypothetical protein n=1 Tax=Streptomyces chrestomyceticus TaxID=68185 RepID=UPI0033FBF725
MTDHRPCGPAYQIPASLLAAHKEVEVLAKALDRFGRAMAVTVAAAVRDILTGFDRAAPFDAAHLELVESTDGSLWATGRYWTTVGEERTFATTPGVHDASKSVDELNEWAPYLDSSTSRVWGPLVSKLPVVEGRTAYRLDLVQAASLDTSKQPLTIGPRFDEHRHPDGEGDGWTSHMRMINDRVHLFYYGYDARGYQTFRAYAVAPIRRPGADPSWRLIHDLYTD